MQNPQNESPRKKWADMSNEEFRVAILAELAEANAKKLRKRKARRRVRTLLKQIKSYEEKLEQKRDELSKLYYDHEIFTYREKDKMGLGMAVQDALRGK